MGKTKKRNVRESIISVLSRDYPLSIRKIYNSVKKEYKLDVTYQAVFKLVKEMLEDGILQNSDSKMEYQLNMGWIKQLEDELNIIKKSYGSSKEDKTKETQENISLFISEVAPKIKAYINQDRSAVIGISGGGRLYGMALWKYITREGKDSKYIDYDTVEEVNRKGIGLKKEDVEGKKVIIVDSAIYSGRTLQTVMKKINLYKKKLGIKEIKFAVDKDHSGLADFYRING
jgi:hypoxanthine-guanine phosphoribosyltransferase